MDVTGTGRPLLTAELLSVGSEITVGDTRDTNAGELARDLTARGVQVLRLQAIPDDLEVVRGALENASSIASMILTTDVLITDLPEKDKAPAMPPGGMGGMDY